MTERVKKLSSIGDKTDKQYKLVPPDGGWGYVIWISISITFVSIFSLVPCFGLLFNEIIEKLQISSTGISLLIGLNCICCSICGFLTGALLKIMSIRRLYFIAALLLNIGTALQVFANSTPVFFISQILFQSTGAGFLFNICFTSVNSYFVEKRLLTLNVCQGITCIATMISPQIIKTSLEHYGHRGTMILVVGLSLQTFVACFLNQPVEWHYKKVLIEPKTELKLLIDKEESTGKSKPKMNSNIEITEKCGEIVDNKFIHESNKVLVEDDNRNFKIYMKSLLKTFDLHLMKNASYVIAILGLSFSSVAHFIYEMMFPLALYDKGWKTETVALALTLYASGDLVTRLIFIIIDKYLKIGNRTLFLIALFIAVVIRLGISVTENRIIILSLVVILGSSRCLIQTLPSLVVADCISPEQFSSAMGIFMLTFGSFTIVFGLIIGVVRDLSQSYATAFHVLTSCIAVVMMFWSIEMCYSNRDKNKTSNKLNTNNKRKKSVRR